MIKIDLITGFLGSGKTTFIKKYARYLLDKGMRIAIVENDFGAINVDMMLLKELEGPNCELEMVVGGEDYDCHKRRFRTKLINLGMLGYDRVIVEPSGVYDVEEFFDVLHESPLDQWYEVGSVIALVDSALENDLSDESNYLLASQIADAGRIVLTKHDTATEEEVHNTIDHLNRVMEKYQCPRRFTEKDCIASDLHSWNDQKFEEIVDAGWQDEPHISLPVARDNHFQTLFYMNKGYTTEQLKDIVPKLFKDPETGNIIRIKGFVRKDDGFEEINATATKFEISSVSAGQEVLIVIGENLNKKQISKYIGEDEITAQRENFTD